MDAAFLGPRRSNLGMTTLSRVSPGLAEDLERNAPLAASLTRPSTNKGRAGSGSLPRAEPAPGAFPEPDSHPQKDPVYVDDEIEGRRSSSPPMAMATPAPYHPPCGSSKNLSATPPAMEARRSLESRTTRVHRTALRISHLHAV